MHLARTAALVLVALYCAYLGVVVVRVVGAVRPIALLLFFCWAVSPVASLLAVRGRSAADAGIAGHLAWWATLFILSATGVAIYQTTFFGGRPDAQSALALVCIPLYQWFVAAVVMIWLGVAAGRVRRRHGA